MKPRGRSAFWSLPLVALLCAGLVGGALLVRGGDASQAPDARPNIVMIIDDDHTAEQQRFLGRTNAEIGLDTGRHLRQFSSSASRSAALVSRDPDDRDSTPTTTGSSETKPPAGGYSKLAPTLGNTLPVWLQRSGYYTGLVGKFLNHYGSADPHAVPPGPEPVVRDARQRPPLHRMGYYASYGYTLNENGSIVHYGTTPRAVDPPAYQTNVFSRLADAFIRRRASSGQPFFLYVAPRDPHVEPTSCNCEGDNPRPPPGYAGRFKGLKARRTPAFNEADVSDKPPEIRNRPRLTPHQEAEVDALYRAQARTLLGVDDLVANVVRTLRQEGKLDNTVILFTSDNGFLHGEHRVSQGKVLPYEPFDPRAPADPGSGFAGGSATAAAGREPRPCADDPGLRPRGAGPRGGRPVPHPDHAQPALLAGPRHRPGGLGQPGEAQSGIRPAARLPGRAHRPLHVRGLRRRAAGAVRPSQGPVRAAERCLRPGLRAASGLRCSEAARRCSRTAPARPAATGRP